MTPPPLGFGVISPPPLHNRGEPLCRVTKGEPLRRIVYGREWTKHLQINAEHNIIKGKRRVHINFYFNS